MVWQELDRQVLQYIRSQGWEVGTRQEAQGGKLGGHQVVWFAYRIAPHREVSAPTLSELAERVANVPPGAPEGAALLVCLRPLSGGGLQMVRGGSARRAVFDMWSRPQGALRPALKS